MKLNKPIPPFVEHIDDNDLFKMIEEIKLIKTDEDICDCCKKEITESLIEDYFEGRRLQ